MKSIKAKNLKTGKIVDIKIENFYSVPADSSSTETFILISENEFNHQFELLNGLGKD